MPRASVALDLAGTDQVAIDSTGHCIGVQVRSYGTARLVKLILRGVEVPRQAVELRVAEVKRAGVWSRWSFWSPAALRLPTWSSIAPSCSGSTMQRARRISTSART